MFSTSPPPTKYASIRCHGHLFSCSHAVTCAQMDSVILTGSLLGREALKMYMLLIARSNVTDKIMATVYLKSTKFT